MFVRFFFHLLGKKNTLKHQHYVVLWFLPAPDLLSPGEGDNYTCRKLLFPGVMKMNEMISMLKHLGLSEETSLAKPKLV